MIFAEALSTLDEYRQFTAAVAVPVLANITEFGKTPLFTTAELAAAGVRLALYPLSAFRAMSKAALVVYAAIRREGTQKSVVPAHADTGRAVRAAPLPRLRAEARCALRREKANRICLALAKPKKSVALSGVPAGNTALCTVGRTGNDLHYRGYDILEIAEACEFEEIAYLLIHEKLPNEAELLSYRAKLKNLRGAARSPCAPCSRLCPRPRIRWTCCARAYRRLAASCRRRRITAPPVRGTSRTAGRFARIDAGVLVSLQPLGQADSRRDRRRFHRRALSASAASARSRRPRGCARCTPRSFCTPSTNSMHPRSPRA